MMIIKTKCTLEYLRFSAEFYVGKLHSKNNSYLKTLPNILI